MANEIQFPTSPTNGNIYSMGGRNYRYDSAQDKFVAVATATIVEGGGVTIYATIDDLPLSGNTQGDLAHVTANNTLYFWNGSGWYKIALINNSPSISNVNSSYTLSDVGADTVITMIAEDPEGLAITYSIASDTSGNTATVVQGTGANTNIFTITPSTDANDNGTFSLTFRASDGVNIATAPASFTLNILTIIENSNYTTALITSVGANLADNNDFIDSSTNNFAITPAGNATQTTFSPHRHGGYSTYFDGTGDYVTAPSDTSFDFGTGDFTIEMWINIPDATSTWQAFISRAYSNNGGWRLYKNTGDNNLRFYYTDGGSTSFLSAINTGITNNTWHHIAVVRNSSTTTIYVDGVSKTSGTITTSLNPGSYAVEVGSGVVTSSFPVTGNMADVRIVKGTAVYTSDFTPPTERLTAITNTSLLTCHLPYIADSSTNGHTITVAGNTKTEPFAPYDYIDTYASDTNGGSLYFDGNGDYLTVPSGAHFADFGTADFTVEWWEYIKAWPSQYFPIFHYGSLGDTSNFTTKFGIRYEGSGASIRIGVSGGYFDFTGLTTPLNVWRHCAIVRSGTTATLYRNGKVDGSLTLSTNITQQNGQSIFGGAYFGGGSGSLFSASGFINDLRVVKGTAVYTSAFTPPTAPLTAITNTSLLFSGTNASIIDKSQTAQTLTLNGDTKSSTTQSKYLSSSMYFDGTGDYVSVANHDSLNFGSGDFTVEAWINTTTKVNYQSIVGKWDNTNGYWLHVESTGYVIGGLDGATYLQGSVDVADGNWHHIAMTRSGTTVRIFVDGTLDSSATQNNTATNTSELRIGSLSSTYARYFVGYISDVRITKGLARYTANFTPPTEALRG